MQGVARLQTIGKRNGGNRRVINSYFNQLAIHLPIGDALLTAGKLLRGLLSLLTKSLFSSRRQVHFAIRNVAEHNVIMQRRKHPSYIEAVVRFDVGFNKLL